MMFFESVGKKKSGNTNLDCMKDSHDKLTSELANASYCSSTLPAWTLREYLVRCNALVLSHSSEFLVQQKAVIFIFS